MSALGAPATQYHPRVTKAFRLRLGADVKVWAGAKCAMADGFVVPVTETLGLKHFCVALETADNTGGSAGDVSGSFEFAVEKTLVRYTNDPDAPVTADEIGGSCYAIDDSGIVSASSDSGARSRIGTPWIVVATGDSLGQRPGVYVELDADAGVTSDELASTDTGGGAALVGLAPVSGIAAGNLQAFAAEIAPLVLAGMPVFKSTVTVGEADLTSAVNGTAQAINIGAALPANARIVGVDMRALTPFTGGSVSAVTCKVGTSGDIDALIATSDLLAAAVDGGPSAMSLGIRPNKTFITAAAQLIATFAPDGGHALASLTAGSVIIDVLYTVLA